MGTSSQVLYILDSSMETVIVNQACHLPSLYWVSIEQSLVTLSCLRMLDSVLDLMIEKRKRASQPGEQDCTFCVAIE